MTECHREIMLHVKNVERDVCKGSERNNAEQMRVNSEATNAP